MPRGYVKRQALDAAVKDAIVDLGPDVVRVFYSLDEDWTGDPSIFFRVVLADRATEDDKLFQTTKRVSSHIEERLEPVEEWGLLAYFNFRSKSEQVSCKKKPGLKQWLQPMICWSKPFIWRLANARNHAKPASSQRFRQPITRFFIC